MVGAEAECHVFLRLTGERIFAFAPIGHGATKRSPKGWTVMTLTEVGKLVDDDVIRQPDRQLQNAPIEIDDTVATA